MNHKIAARVPEAITQLRHQLEQFRSTRPARTKLPESFWQAAVEVARQHGIYAVAHPLRLDYTRLKERLDGMPSQPRRQNKPAFVELIGDSAAALPECVIEFESPGSIATQYANLRRDLNHPVSRARRAANQSNPAGPRLSNGCASCLRRRSRMNPSWPKRIDFGLAEEVSPDSRQTDFLKGRIGNYVLD